MAEQNTQEYVPSESVEANMDALKRFNSKKRAERSAAINAGMNAPRKISRMLNAGTRYVGAVGFGFFTTPSTKDVAPSENTVVEEVDKNFGAEELPVGIKDLANTRNQRIAQGLSCKVLSYDYKARELSPVAVLQAGQFGLVSVTSSAYKLAKALQTKYDKSSKQAAIPGSEKFVMDEVNVKSLPEQSRVTLDYIQTKSDFERAAENASDYLITDSSQLNTLGTESHIENDALRQADEFGANSIEDVVAPFNIDKSKSFLERNLEAAASVGTQRGYDDFLQQIDKNVEEAEAASSYDFDDEPTI